MKALIILLVLAIAAASQPTVAPPADVRLEGLAVGQIPDCFQWPAYTKASIGATTLYPYVNNGVITYRCTFLATLNPMGSRYTIPGEFWPIDSYFIPDGLLTPASAAGVPPFSMAWVSSVCEPSGRIGIDVSIPSDHRLIGHRFYYQGVSFASSLPRHSIGPFTMVTVSP